MLAFREVSQAMQTILRVFKYIRRYPWLATGTVGFAVLATLMVIVFPTVTQRVIDDAIRGRKPELILPLALLAIGAFFVQSAVQWNSDRSEQHVRTESHFRFSQRPLRPYPEIASALV